MSSDLFLAHTACSLSLALGLQYDRFLRDFRGTVPMASNSDFPIWFFPSFVSMWLGVNALLSFMSGWYKFAKRFRCPESFRAEKNCGLTSISLGFKYFPVNYGNCVFVKIGNTGIRLSVLFIFRFMSPPFVIPWEEIENVRRSRYFLFGSTVLNVKRDSRRFRFYWGTGEALFETCKQRGIKIEA